MADLYSKQERDRLDAILKVHLKDEEQQSLPVDEQIPILEKKKRKQGWFLVINIIAILFFSYSFLYNITQLSNTILYILGAVFLVNVLLIFYQRKQIVELIIYLKKTSNTA